MYLIRITSGLVNVWLMLTVFSSHRRQLFPLHLFGWATSETLNCLLSYLSFFLLLPFLHCNIVSWVDSRNHGWIRASYAFIFFCLIALRCTKRKSLLGRRLVVVHFFLSCM